MTNFYIFQPKNFKPIKIVRGLLVFIAMVLFFACGIKREPEPGKNIYALPVVEIQAKIQEACIELIWNYSEEEKPKQFLLLRRETKAGEANFPEPKVLVSLDSAERSYLDCSIQSGYDYGYSLISVSKLGLKGEEGKMVWVNFP